MHHLTRNMNVEEGLALLQSMDEKFRTTCPFEGHMVPWSTPSGCGVEGRPLQYVEGGWFYWHRGGRVPCAGAPHWPTVADHLRGYWRPGRALWQVLDQHLPPCGCE